MDFDPRRVLNALAKFAREQRKWRAWFEAFRRNLTPVERILQGAISVYPQIYVIEHEIAAGATTAQPGQERINDGTRFILDRIVGSWLVTGQGGAVQDRWWPFASSDPFIASTIAGGVAMPDTLDYFWQLTDAGRGRDISNKSVPGDQLYRHDWDGIMGRYPPVFDGNNAIRTSIQPTTGPPRAGTFYMCLWGLEARMVEEGITEQELREMGV